MAADSPGISGLGVGITAVGGVLVWSAIRNVIPADTMRSVLGRPNNSTPISTPFSSVSSGVRGVTAAKKVASSDWHPSGEGSAGTLSGQAGRLVAEARILIGVPYVWAAASQTGVDCSGLVVLCLRRMGIDAPRFTTYTFGSWASGRNAMRVKPEQFQAGDVILRSGHMGIAVSGSRLIHAPTVGDRVKEAEIWDRGNWWGYRLFGAVAASDSAGKGAAEEKKK